MKKKYSDLNLSKLRNDNGLDFVHFTYLRVCAVAVVGRMIFRNDIGKNREIIYLNDYYYILFANSDNGIGVVRRKDYIENNADVFYKVKGDAQLIDMCVDLQN